MYIPIWEKFSSLWIISLFEIHGHFTSEKNIIEDTKEMHITKTRLYNFDPFKPHFYIVKLGFTRAYIICLISAQEYQQSMFWAEIWKISEFLSKFV